MTNMTKDHVIPAHPSDTWGEDDPEREYAEAEAKGEAALDRLGKRRFRREERLFWEPLRAARDREFREQQAARVEQERVEHAARMREYRAKKKAERLALQRGADQ
jgi:hypothetical protein